jgi:cell division protein FtsI/penicillin-binding protein 2
MFGFDSKPPIDLTPVSTSNFPTPAELAPTGTLALPGVALSAFGQQTVTATALQNAMVAAGIADTGTVMTPHVMSQIRNATDDLVKSYTPSVYKQAATPAAALSVNKLMQSVVTTPKGTAAGVGFPATEHVAVKTGTAQAGTGNTNTTDWMIGFAPATHPAVAVAVVVPQQARSASGASIAGPIVKAMVSASLAAVATSATGGSASSSTGETTTAATAGGAHLAVAAGGQHPIATVASHGATSIVPRPARIPATTTAAGAGTSAARLERAVTAHLSAGPP